MRNGYVSEGDSSEYARDLRIFDSSPVSYQVKPGQRRAIVSEAGVEPIAHQFTLSAGLSLGVDGG